MVKTKKNAKKNSKQSYMKKKAAIAQLTSSKNSVRVCNAKTDYEPCSTITVKNAEGDADTVAQILIQNKIDYTPKVSVVIPVYNVEPYLRKCLDSVINQTLKEIEIICVDDGSTDASLDILKEYAAKDNRITIITQKNLYAGVARNAGLSQAKGEYLSFLDSDDFFELNMLEEMYSKSIQYEADFCISHVKMYNMAKETLENCLWGLRDEYLPQNHVFSAKDIYDKIYQVNQGWVWDKIYNREFILNNGIKFQASRSSNDVYFNFCHLTIAKKIVIVDDFLMTHRLHVKGSLENTRERSYNNICNAIKKIQHYLIMNNLYERVKISFVNFAISNIMWNYDTLKEPSKTFLLEVIHEYYEKLFYSISRKDYFKLELYEKFKNILKKAYIINPKEYIPIVFATNKGYCLPCVVAIKSLIKHASKKRKYAIFVLHSELDENDIRSLENLNTKNVFVHCMTVDVEKLVGSSFSYTCAHYSKEMYYRILIPQLFGIYDKVVYLDCDIVLMRDVYNLYKTSLGDNVVAAVINPVLTAKNYVESILNVNSEKYFNSGILVINNKKFKELKIKEKCLEYLEQFADLKFPDQDVLNMACLGYVYYLNIKWNYQWFFRIDNISLPLYCRKDYEEAEKDPYIIHYASGKKPWNFDDKKFAKEWKKYCRKIHPTKSIYNLEERLKTWYYLNTKKVLNLDNPKTYNEKLQWLKLYNALPVKTLLADKYLVREWVKEKIGEEYLIPIFGAYDSFEKIDFDKLPNQFVIKCNHGSGYNIIVKDKSQLDIQDTKEKLDKWVNENFAYRAGFEMHYLNIKPKIIIEQYINPEKSNHEIQVWCFDNKIKFISVESIKDEDNLERGTFYPDGSVTEFAISPNHYKPLKKISSIKAFNKAIQLAEKMLVNVPYLRIDFIEYNDDIRFREMTFTSGSGLSVISPIKYNKILGDWITLPKLAYNIDTKKYYKLPKQSLIKPYILFPYYVIKKKILSSKLTSTLVANIVGQLTTTHINIRNVGSKANSIDILTSNCNVSSPDWLKRVDGIGKFVTGSSLKQYIKMKIINDGELSLSFKGCFKLHDGKHLPVWIDYKSIKINAKEILSEPVATWHDKPFNYYMTVKDGQEVSIEVEQQYHQYAEDELKELLIKLNSNSNSNLNYIKEDVDNVIKYLKKILPVIDEDTYKQIQLNNYVKKITTQLTSTHINIKNRGSKDNSVEIIDTNIETSSPSWIVDEKGKGVYATGSSLKQHIKMKIINDGELSLSFKGCFKLHDGKHLPVWIDYKSIKINKFWEILAKPVATWHDKPYRYEIPVKNGQEITLEVEQQCHEYTENELRDLLIKLYSKDDFVKENLDTIIIEVAKKMETILVEHEASVA